MKTAIINSDSCEKHNTGDGHPEQPKRVIAIKEKLKKRKDLIWDKPDNVPDHILSMTHSEDYINNLKNSFPQKGLKFLDGDTVVSPESKKAVFDAAGSTIRAIDGIEGKQFKNAFLNCLPSIPSIALMVEPAASKTAFLLSGDTTVSPSKNLRPFWGKEFFKLFI